MDRSRAAQRLRIAVLASGRGSNLEALHRATVDGRLGATIVLVVSNNSGAGALAYARAHGIAAVHTSARTDVDPGAALLERLESARTDVVALAGYMKLLDARVVAAYRGRAVNIHPGPLPAFGGPGMFGEHVHAAVLAAGVPASGPTVHLVSEHYDEGDVLGHTPVPVLPGDDVASLAARVLAAEHELYWRVIAERFVTAA
jgi:phosphoribosylglycinamide formyltransferase-1